MVRCSQCISQNKQEQYTDPYESAYRRYKTVNAFINYIAPTYTKCNIDSCGNTVEVSGWFESDPHL